MSEMSRILVVDDNEAIHHDFRQILDRTARNASLASLDELERALGGEPTPPPPTALSYWSTFAAAAPKMSTT